MIDIVNYRDKMIFFKGKKHLNCLYLYYIVFSYLVNVLSLVNKIININ